MSSCLEGGTTIAFFGSMVSLREDPEQSAARAEEPRLRESAHQLLDELLTSPDRVLYPEQGITKRELAEYQLLASKWMLPHVEDRFLTLVRCPAGREKPCFFQKHARSGLPEQVLPYDVGDEGQEPYIYVRDAVGLVALVQGGALELHPWGCRIDRLERPDRLVFDLDPAPNIPWERVAESALDVKKELQRLGLVSFVKTTGGKGLHVVVPLSRRNDWNEAKVFARAVAEKMAGEEPDRYVAQMAKDKRVGKVFIDYLRNARGATSVAPYSARARPGAPVATPLEWEELEEDPRTKFHVRSVPERLERLATDPWEGFFDVRQSLTKKARRTLKLI